MLEAYAVRQRSTGLFIPRLETGRRRGGSHLEPTAEREPRLFHNKLAARAFISNWLQGISVNSSEYDYDGNEESRRKVTKMPHRKKEDMEIVRFECHEVSE